MEGKYNLYLGCLRTKGVKGLSIFHNGHCIHLNLFFNLGGLILLALLQLSCNNYITLALSSSLHGLYRGYRITLQFLNIFVHVICLMVITTINCVEFLFLHYDQQFGCASICEHASGHILLHIQQELSFIIRQSYLLAIPAYGMLVLLVFRIRYGFLQAYIFPFYCDIS